MEPSILMNRTRCRIVHLLVTDGPATAPEISSALSIARYVVDRELTLLTSAGLIRANEMVPDNLGTTFAAETPQVFREMAQLHHFLGLDI